jgi:protease IV
MEVVMQFSKSYRNIVIFFLLAGLVLSQGCMMINLPTSFSSELTESTLREAKGWFVSEKILILDINGVINDQDDRSFLGGGSACTPYYVKAVLDKAETDPAIRAVVLRIDSPGGTVSASQVISREVAGFRKRTGKPVYAHIQATGCSGAYMLAAACSKIHIQPAGITGSIGVIAMLPKMAKLADKVGYEQVVIKSGPMKDLGNSMRDMTDEEKAVFQGIIDSSYDDFIDWIIASRPDSGKREAVKTVADGRIYNAKQALQNKLVDRICQLDETVEAAMKEAGVIDASIISYGYVYSSDANLYSPVSSSGRMPLLNVRLPDSLPGMHTGFYYLWLPGR